MGDPRRPVEVWKRQLPQNQGRKSGKNLPLKIELFPIHFWSKCWEPGSNLFSPKLPLQSRNRKEYWITRYRVRVNGKWVGSRAKYVGYTREQIFRRYFQS